MAVKRIVQAVSLSGALLAAGCGGGGDATNTTATTSTPEAEANNTSAIYAYTQLTPSTPCAHPNLSKIAQQLASEPGAPIPTCDTGMDAFNWLNFRRTKAGMPAVSNIAALNVAAKDHINYVVLNGGLLTHNEASTNPGYTGATHTQRIAAAGYTGQNYAGEILAAASEAMGFYHADALIHMIYHRFIALEPAATEAGYGVATAANAITYVVLELASKNPGGIGTGNIVTYPYAGQTSVDTSFVHWAESPDPFPEAAYAQKEVGYPISVHANHGSSMQLTSFTVKERNGATLDVRTFVTGTDAHVPSSAAAIIPTSPLKADTHYDVNFAGTVNGTAKSMSWSFTTR